MLSAIKGHIEEHVRQSGEGGRADIVNFFILIGKKREIKRRKNEKESKDIK